MNWHAGRIDDPVRRLGYLRRSANFWSQRPIRHILVDARLHRLSVFLLAAMVLPVPMVTDAAALRTVNASVRTSAPDQLPHVWQVETTAGHELYSNGLRIETIHTAPAEGAENFQRWRIDSAVREESPTPFGIVFHTTESDTQSYDETNNRRLRRAAEGTLGFVRQTRAYNFVIDRFGRVFRTVPENEPANHAGPSVWADEQYFYVNLNHSFLGISFDGQSKGPDGQPSLTEPQLHSARLLTEMLRGRYRIAAANCTTHAQVSVNPLNMAVGYHTDLAMGFPYQRIGLPSNYVAPLPAITLFGFHYEDSYAEGAGEELKDGISAGETVLRQGAIRLGMTPAAYRKVLAARFREVDDPKRWPPAE